MNFNKPNFVNGRKRLLSEEDLHESLNSNIRNDNKNSFGSFNKSNITSYTNTLKFSNNTNSHNNNTKYNGFNVNSFKKPNQLTFSDTNSSSNRNINSTAQPPLKSLKLSPLKFNSPSLSLNNANGFKPQLTNIKPLISSNLKPNPFINNNNDISVKPKPNTIFNDEDLFKSDTDGESQIEIDIDDIDIDINDINDISNDISNDNNNNNSEEGKTKGKELNQQFDEFFESFTHNSQTSKSNFQGLFSNSSNKQQQQQQQQQQEVIIVSSIEIKEKVEHETFQKFGVYLDGNITNLHQTNRNQSELIDLPDDLPEILRNALNQLGYSKLYSHQIHSRNFVQNGDNIIITTPTSSGKSICLSVPIFESILKFKIQNNNSSGSGPTALFLFPLKALANDQIQSITKLNNAIDRKFKLSIKSISGGLNASQIPIIFENNEPDILLTNPDWLHYQLFRGGSDDKKWNGWKKWFARLKFIVLDEIHTYSGVMGCHFINLLRRLINYHSFLNENNDGSSLQFLLASATIGNPIQTGLKMLSKQQNNNNNNNKLQLIDKSGSGNHSKTFLTLKTHKNPYYFPSLVLHYWIQLKITGIVFCNSIKSLNSLLQHLSTDTRYQSDSKYIKPYYASLSEAHKKETLDQLKTGQIRVILSTNALEAGIDIAELDACLIIGYPGSRMSWRQRVGRVGRSKPGLVVYIPDHYSPTDKYYSQNPTALFEGEPEAMTFNGDFPTILSSHLLCAASEIGIPSDLDRFKEIFGSLAEPVLQQLINEKQLIHLNKRWISKQNYHLKISIRGGSGTGDIVKVKQDNRQLEQVTRFQAITRFFPGSVFINYSPSGGVQSFIVKELSIGDSENEGLAQVSQFTHPRNCRVVTIPNKYGVVEMTNILKEQVIPLKDGISNDEVMLKITFGVANYTTVVDSFETRTYHHQNQSTRIDDDSFNMSKFESEITPLKNRLEIGFEAPCLEFSFTNSIKPLFDSTFEKTTERLKMKLNESPFLDRKENDSKLSDLKEHGVNLISLHTIVHQILSAFPMLLSSSKSEIEECYCLPKGFPISTSNIIRNNIGGGINNNNGNLNSSGNSLNNTGNMNKNSIYLVDNVEGGSGSCQDIFDNIHQILQKAIELNFCPNCNDLEEKSKLLSEEFGCLFCLHSNHCKNKGLLKSLGILNLDLSS